MSKIDTNRSSGVKCYAFFKDGDQLFEFLLQSPAKLASLPSVIENRYYSSRQAAKISDCYFYFLKYVMDNIGVSSFLAHRSNGFLNLMPITTGLLVFATIAYTRPDYTFLSKIFSITSAHTYSILLALNSYISLQLVKGSIDLSATTINVLIGIWHPDFFSRGQIWATTERILNNAKSVAKIAILVSVQNSEEAQRHLRVHKKLLRPLESYFNPSEVENMNLLPSEFSHSDMSLLSDGLNEIDEFSRLSQAGTPVQMLLFLLVCRELKFNLDEESSSGKVPVVNKTETNKNIGNKNLSLCKKMLKVLVYRSSALRSLRKASRIFVSSRGIVDFARNSYEKSVIKQRNLNVEYLNRCFQSKNLT